MTMAVLPRMLERDSGVIVNVSSLGGRLGILHETSYSASKFALCGWSEALALDLWNTGVEVRLVIPGPIATEIWDLPDNETPLYNGPFEPPETVAADIIRAIEGDAFEVYSPDMKSIAEFKTSDIDTFLAGAAAMGDARGGCRESARLPHRSRARRPAGARRAPARAASRVHADEGRGRTRSHAHRRRLGGVEDPPHAASAARTRSRS